MGNNQIIRRVLGSLVALGIAATLQAQTFPNKPVKTVITFTPGSATDIVGRVVSQKLSEYWGQPVVPENRAGAGGSIASAYVAKSDPDGYTLLINSNAHTVNPAIFAKLPYDTLKDFVDVAPFTVQPQVLVVSPESAFKTVADLVAYGKSKPEAINFAHAGIGSGTHLNTEVFIAAAGIKVTQIVYKGTPEAFGSVMSRTADCFWAPLSAALSNIRGGKLRPLAVSTPKRNPMLPDVPTTGEAGVSNADAPGWFGIWAPAGTPTAVVNKINADVRRVLADAAVKERLVNMGQDTLDMSPDEFAKFVRSEVENNHRVIKAAGIKPQ
ncbi:MAG: Bug family tripartite tricarboxylate transporter substrate binding protein [Burkholderiales bacterium]